MLLESFHVPWDPLHAPQSPLYAPRSALNPGPLYAPWSLSIYPGTLSIYLRLSFGKQGNGEKVRRAFVFLVFERWLICFSSLAHLGKIIIFRKRWLKEGSASRNAFFLLYLRGLLCAKCCVRLQPDGQTAHPCGGRLSPHRALKRPSQDCPAGLSGVTPSLLAGEGICDQK